MYYYYTTDIIKPVGRGESKVEADTVLKLCGSSSDGLYKFEDMFTGRKFEMSGNDFQFSTVEVMENEDVQAMQHEGRLIHYRSDVSLTRGFLIFLVFLLILSFILKAAGALNSGVYVIGNGTSLIVMLILGVLVCGCSHLRARSKLKSLTMLKETIDDVEED